MTTPHRLKTVAIQRSIETGERGPLAHFDSRRYVQHNLMLGDGFGALLQFLDSLPPGTSKVTPVRAFEDTDLGVTFAHFEYHLEPLGHVVGFEVHRWEDGHIVEHWDNLQPMPHDTNASGLSVLDGPTEATTSYPAAGTTSLVRTLVESLVRQDVGRLHETVDVDRFAEHSTLGRSALGGAIGGETGVVVYTKLHHVFTDADFGLALSQCRRGDDTLAVYDLFRVEQDRIVEHWDVIETIPHRDQWQNANGKF